MVMRKKKYQNETAAGAVGTACVLYDGGSHHLDDLEDVGVPVAGSLVDAVEVATRLER